ncbi:MAG: YicC/YloC family endoribonuclease [Verrucomicrobiota bacterium]
MKSMTGFGRAERSKDGLVVALQISSVNRKNLEVFCTLPKEFQQLERKVTEIVRSKATRGRFQFSLEIRNDETAATGLPSDAQVDGAMARLKAISERLGIPYEVSTDTIVDVAKLLDTDGGELPEDEVEALLLEATEAAMVDLVAMREKEGTALKEDLRERSENLATLVAEIKEHAPSMVLKQRENLMSRLQQAGLELDLDDERVLKEIAIFADRCDISEELTRLESHFEQFGSLLDKEEAVGRSIEFLVQEIGREINTTGSKACLIEISRCVMSLKNELERIREQVANVE